MSSICMYIDEWTGVYCLPFYIEYVIQIKGVGLSLLLVQYDEYCTYSLMMELLSSYRLPAFRTRYHLDLFIVLVSYISKMGFTNNDLVQKGINFDWKMVFVDLLLKFWWCCLFKFQFPFFYSKSLCLDHNLSSV